MTKVISITKVWRHSSQNQNWMTGIERFMSYVVSLFSNPFLALEWWSGGRWGTPGRGGQWRWSTKEWNEEQRSQWTGAASLPSARDVPWNVSDVPYLAVKCWSYHDWSFLRCYRERATTVRGESRKAVAKNVCFMGFHGGDPDKIRMRRLWPSWGGVLSAKQRLSDKSLNLMGR